MNTTFMTGPEFPVLMPRFNNFPSDLDLADKYARLCGNKIDPVKPSDFNGLSEAVPTMKYRESFPIPDGAGGMTMSYGDEKP